MKNFRPAALSALLIASSLMLGTATVRAAEETPPLKVLNTAGIAHVSGGVGAEEMQQIKALTGKFNLRLLMTGKDGNYLAGVSVAIADRRGGKVLETVADGPYLLAQLPPGEYQVTAAAGGETRQQRVTLAASGQREIRFHW